MHTIKYDFGRRHPRLFGRCLKSVDEIPVFYNGKVQCHASMDESGKFFLSVSEALALRLKNDDAYIEAEWTEAYLTPPDEPPGPVRVLSLRIIDVPFLY